MNYQDSLKGDFRNFLFACWKFLGLPSPTDLQYTIAAELQDPDEDRLVVECFRGIGKSWITSAYVCWLLLNDPTLNILVVSASKGRADEFSQFVQQLIMNWEVLEPLRPRNPRVDERWALDKFDVRDAGYKHQPSVKSASLFGQITGSRADVIIADDVEVPNNSETPMMREKLRKRVSEFSAILTPGKLAKIVFLGTPQTEDSLYNKLWKMELVDDDGSPYRYRVSIIPARYPSPQRRAAYGNRLHPVLCEHLDSGEAQDGDPTEPIRFSETELAKREVEYGRTGFALQFLLDTTLADQDRYPLKVNDLVVMNLNSETGPEKVSWGPTPKLRWNDSLPCVGFDGDGFYRPIPDEEVQWVKYEGAVMAIDPSGRGKDETAYAVVKIIGSTLFLLRCGGFTDGFAEKNLQEMARICAEEKVNYVAIEKNFGDGMFAELFKPHLKQYHSATIEEVTATGQKEQRICDSLEPILNAHRLVVDRKVIEDDYHYVPDVEEERKDQYRLIHQLSRITRERGSLIHDDRLEVVQIACSWWISRLALTPEQTVERRRRKAMDAEFKKHMDTAFGYGPKLQRRGRRRRGRNGLGLSRIN